MDLQQFLIDFQDHLAPKLDTYEQAIYLYIFRHSRLMGLDDVVIGFKSARKRMALGIGKAGTPMSENQCYENLKRLQIKGLLEICGTERSGTRLRLRLPSEVDGLVASPSEDAQVDIEQIDFFEVPDNRRSILEREGHLCFYCRRKLNDQNYVIEHVQSRPDGNNSYRNVVAACRECNNRKSNSSAEDWLRTLYREAFLGPVEFEERLSHLQQLKAGLLKPTIQ